MINLVSSKKLDIILPNTNKALKEVLKGATHKELESISRGKDLKSIMSSILKQSLLDNTSDKSLLKLVKNNPTLKSLGDVSTTIKDLLNTIKSDKNPLPIEKVLKNFLVEIKDVKDFNNIKDVHIKQKFENSGVFLESRIKDVKSPQVELKTVLNSLEKILTKSEFSSAKSILNEVKTLLNTQLSKEQVTQSSPKDLPQQKMLVEQKELPVVASKVRHILSELKSTQKFIDPLQKPVVENAVKTLEHLTSAKMIKVEEFKYPQVKEALEQIQTQVSKSLNVEAKGIVDALQKVFSALKIVEQNATNTKVLFENILTKDIPKELPKDIKNITQNIKDIILKADPIFSKPILSIINKLESLSSIKQLNPAQNVKEVLSNDLKSVLLQANEEISKSNHPNKNDLLKHIDKLALQIDNFQLVSHLSNASSLYLPYSWDGLEEGKIEMRKADDDKFYCDIDLKLKEYGELNFKLTLYEKNQLNLHIYTTNKEFQNIVKENLQELRGAIIDVNVTPREIRIFEPKDDTKATSAYGEYNDDLAVKFEAKA